MQILLQPTQVKLYYFIGTQIHVIRISRNKINFKRFWNFRNKKNVKNLFNLMQHSMSFDFNIYQLKKHTQKFRKKISDFPTKIHRNEEKSMTGRFPWQKPHSVRHHCTFL